MVIDNSGSMTQSDPLRLRGVAAGLILDAVEVSSDVKAGLVMFSDQAQTDGQLGDTDRIRQRLQAAQLPSPNGGTNMEQALEKAIGMLSNSTADIKRIVIITDGQPDSEGGILTNLVPHARQAGIQIFALGFSGAVNQAFLDKVTVPTGGRTLVTPNQQKLLESAKELVGNLDSMFNLKDQHLASNETSFDFDLPAGADRARVTAILDQPQAFAQNEIQFSLQGPPGTGDHTYIIRDDRGYDRVAAWTTFFSTPGHYTFHVTTSRQGVSGHLGLHFFAEALSSMRVKLIVNPQAQSYTVGDQLRVDAQASTGSGPLNPATAHVVAFIKTPSGGSQAVSFSGLQAIFPVPDVPGRQTLVVRVETPLAHAEAHFDYEVVPPDRATLVSDRDALKFGPLGPEHPQVEESFKLTATYPAGIPYRPVKFSFTLNSPVGSAELVGPGGTVYKSGISQYQLPPNGLPLTLRIKIDPNKTLPPAGIKFAENITFSSSDARSITIRFEGVFQKPKFELEGKLKDFTLWWDPHRTRLVRLGDVTTDLSEKSTFNVTIPDAIYDANKGTKIADLTLRAGGADLPDPETIEKGKLRYGPIELPPGKGLPLDLVITPDQHDGWEMQPSNGPFDVRLNSSLGMAETVSPRFWSAGAAQFPLLKSRLVSGRNLATAGWCLFAGLILFLFAWLKGRATLRFWHYRPGSVQPLGLGPIQLGGDGGGAAAIALPSVSMPGDVRVIGQILLAGGRQRVESYGEPIVQTPYLSPGDTLTIADSVEVSKDGSEGADWTLEYIGYESGVGGEVEVMSSPARWTPGRLIKWLVIGLAFLLFVKFLLGTAAAASLAYHLRPIESLYMR